MYNLVIGETFVWYEGKMKCTNLTTGHKAEISFKEKGFFSDKDYNINGNAFDNKGICTHNIKGQWNKEI